MKDIGNDIVELKTQLGVDTFVLKGVSLGGQWIAAACCNPDVHRAGCVGAITYSAVGD